MDKNKKIFNLRKKHEPERPLTSAADISRSNKFLLDNDLILKSDHRPLNGLSTQSILNYNVQFDLNKSLVDQLNRKIATTKLSTLQSIPI